MEELKHGLRRDIQGNVIDLDGTVLERCENCKQYCLPDSVVNLICLCEDCIKLKTPDLLQ